MKKFNKYIISITAVISIFVLPTYSQWTAEELEAWLNRLVETENPVYMPVIGVGLGFFNYHGNLKNSLNGASVNSFTTRPGVHVNVSMFLTQQKDRQFVRANIYGLMGNISGTQRYVPQMSDIAGGQPEDFEKLNYRNLNFSSQIVSFGVGITYSFKPMITGKFFEPFISLGFDFLQFDTQTDDRIINDVGYHFWTDGTIRDRVQSSENLFTANIINRNYLYNTDVRTLNRNQFSNPNYSKFTFALPVDIGVDFNLSQRVSLRAATSFRFLFNDLLDDMSSTSNNPNYKGKNSYSLFSFTYVALHFDIFSDPTTRRANEVFMDLADSSMDIMITMEDTDGDFVPDWHDLCPDTPWDLEVDEDGCPVDSDGDGIPDHMDDEPNSRPGAIVDDRGVEMTEEAIIESLNMQSIRRSEVESFLLTQRAQNIPRRSNVPLPAKFHSTDVNNDGFISFDEFLKAINDFFDGNSSLTADDLNELKDFFFEQ